MHMFVVLQVVSHYSTDPQLAEMHQEMQQSASEGRKEDRKQVNIDINKAGLKYLQKNRLCKCCMRGSKCTVRPQGRTWVLVNNTDCKVIFFSPQKTSKRDLEADLLSTKASYSSESCSLQLKGPMKRSVVHQRATEIKRSAVALYVLQVAPHFLFRGFS